MEGRPGNLITSKAKKSASLMDLGGGGCTFYLEEIGVTQHLTGLPHFCIKGGLAAKALLNMYS